MQTIQSPRAAPAADLRRSTGQSPDTNSPVAKRDSQAEPRTLDLSALFDLSRQPGYYNAAAKVALLRRSKRQPHDQLLVDFQRPEIHVALKAAGALVVDGTWDHHSTVNGRPLEAKGAWIESCWHRDARSDYLELERELTDGWRLERQMLLARKERFLLIADALVGPGSEPVEIRHAFSLPPAEAVAWSGAKETREGWWMVKDKRAAAVVPPALPEWREEFSHARLAMADGRLQLEQAAHGCALYAPLFIDLDPKRARRPLTWRRLTVAENLAVVPRDVAVAYRVQVGDQQWAFYRSLAPVGNRTFLGQNYSTEFVACRLKADADGDEIVSIEGANH